MILEHEIPSGSRLYFGKSAKIKRTVEAMCAKKLDSFGFSEISTPLFSYHQQDGFIDRRVLIRVNDANNSEVSLRADSTVDVVRIATNRLARSEDIKKWFYIQPIFSFPTQEQYQIGAEILDGTLSEIANISLELLKDIDIKFKFQVANMALANILINQYEIELEDIVEVKIEKLLNYGYSWMSNLINISKVKDLKNLDSYPDDIKIELKKILDVAKKIDAYECIVSPLYYAPMHYYNSLIFRAFDGQNLYLTGGEYSIKGVNGAGFAIYTDTVIANKMQRD